ncbi:MAG TPA: tetratricopeptide repeat protein [Bdellovibrionota bacterium]|nr:tetratricopeptide repeat protein [Bdellovibrionota bacterium]
MLRITRANSSLRSPRGGVETAKIAGLAILALAVAERWAIGAPSAEKIRWPSLDAVAASDYQEARELLAKRKWAEAAIILKSVLRKDPDYSPAAIQLAEALYHSNRREEGLSVLSQAASRERGPRRAALQRRLGVLSRSFLTTAGFQQYQDGLNLMLTRKYRAARERFERVLGDEPANVEVLVRVGESLVLENDWDSAAERLRLARKLNPHQPEIRLWLGRALHQRGELAEAVEELKAARAELPGSELAPLWLAEAYVSLGRRDDAVAVLEDDLGKQPLHVQALLLLAQFRVGAPQSGRKTLMEARRALQLAESRLADYLAPASSRIEGELGIDLRRPGEELKNEIKTLFQRIDGRLEELNAEV